MYKFYGDDSALRKSHGEENRSIFLFGGILVSKEEELRLSAIIKSIKNEYTEEYMPFKYNIKDLEEVYHRFSRDAEFERIKSDSIRWRNRIIEESLNYNYTIFISCIENIQAYKKEQKEIKKDLSSFLFANTLMRVGMYSKINKLDYVQAILDWPEGNDPKPFDKEYFNAYNFGRNSSGQGYKSGALKDLNFDQTLYFARCNHSNMLQLADIIIGSSRDWMETELQKRDSSVGKKLTSLFFPKLYGYPNNILGLGINVSSRNENLRTFLKETIKNIVFS
jgi:hypothetical protein